MLLTEFLYPYTNIPGFDQPFTDQHNFGNYMDLVLMNKIIDIKDHRRHLKFFTIVGMNAIFTYLFFEIVGSRWFNGYIGKITNGLMDFANIPEMPKLIITSLCIFILEWLLCYFLYRKKYFLNYRHADTT
jgi:predicted acyltransferase